MVQQQRAFDTRDKIVDGAARTFYRLGYGIATTADIVKDAGVTRGAMYFHFPSKEQLARAVIDKEQDIAVAAGKRIQAMKRPALETMILLCIDLAERLQTNPVVRAGIRLTTENTNFDPPLVAPYESWLRTFADLARLAIDQGDFLNDVDPVAFSRVLIPAYTGVQLVSDTFTERADLLPRIHEMWKLFIRAVTPLDRRQACINLLDSLIHDRMPLGKLSARSVAVTATSPL